jgi:uncharacterized repeat protein (TIGR04138 family)
MNEDTLYDRIDELRERDARFRREAYLFVLAALEYVVGRLPERRHVSGQELLQGVADLARRNFGALAGAVFSEWGVESSTDVGEIVFQLVGAGIMGRRPEDSLDDFADFDLPAALRVGRS